MFNFGPTFIWTAVNLLVLWLVLRKILFKKVTGFMQNRTDSIQNAIDDSIKSREEAQRLKAQYEAQLKEARVEAAAIVNDARSKANVEYDKILSDAKEQAQAVMDRARAEIEQERIQMLKDVKNQVASLALSAASKVIEANMDTESNKALVDKFIKEEGAA